MEYVRVNYPRARRVLVDGDNPRPTNEPFRVDRGTHSFSIDEAAQPPEIVEFIELTSQQAPRELFFMPAVGVTSLEMTTRSLRTAGAAPRPISTRKPPRRKRTTRKAGTQRRPTAKKTSKTKQAAKGKPPPKRKRPAKAKRPSKTKRPATRTARR